MFDIIAFYFLFVFDFIYISSAVFAPPSPFRFAYIEFADKESVRTAMALDESLFRGRQIKVRLLLFSYFCYLVFPLKMEFGMFIKIS